MVFQMLYSEVTSVANSLRSEHVPKRLSHVHGQAQSCATRGKFATVNNYVEVEF